MDNILPFTLTARIERAQKNMDALMEIYMNDPTSENRSRAINAQEEYYRLVSLREGI